MKKLLIVPFLLTACATPKFSRGDCITPDVNALEAWQDPTALPKFTALVLDVGHHNYRVLISTPFGAQDTQGKIKEVDQQFTATTCPVDATTALEQFPSVEK